MGRWGRGFSAPADGAQGIPGRPSGNQRGSGLSSCQWPSYEPLGLFRGYLEASPAFGSELSSDLTCVPKTHHPLITF